jgi:hypothetical protein
LTVLGISECQENAKALKCNIVATEGIAPTTSSAASSCVIPTSKSDGKSLLAGAKADIGVGISLVGLAILAGIIWFALRRQRRSREDEDRIGHEIYIRKPELNGSSGDDWESGQVAEVEGPFPRHELDGTQYVELGCELPHR